MTQRLRTVNETQNEEVEFGKRQRVKNGWDVLCLCSTSTTTCKVGRISSVSRALAAEREIAGLIPGVGQILRVLK